jgi:hypothetical protein
MGTSGSNNGSVYRNGEMGTGAGTTTAQGGTGTNGAMSSNGTMTGGMGTPRGGGGTTSGATGQ